MRRYFLTIPGFSRRRQSSDGATVTSRRTLRVMSCLLLGPCARCRHDSHLPGDRGTTSSGRRSPQDESQHTIPLGLAILRQVYTTLWPQLMAASVAAILPILALSSSSSSATSWPAKSRVRSSRDMSCGHPRGCRRQISTTSRGGCTAQRDASRRRVARRVGEHRFTACACARRVDRARCGDGDALRRDARADGRSPARRGDHRATPTLAARARARPARSPLPWYSARLPSPSMRLPDAGAGLWQRSALTSCSSSSSCNSPFGRWRSSTRAGRCAACARGGPERPPPARLVLPVSGLRCSSSTLRASLPRFSRS